MKDRPHDPRRLDVRRFAATAAQLRGRAGAGELPRLVADAPLAGGDGAEWSMRGEQRPGVAGEPEVWLHLQARAHVVLPCQRCLQPMTLPLQAARSIRFVDDEAEAERLDEELDDDVLAAPARGRVDALALVEDELIFALPLVPRHDTCPEPLPAPADTARATEADAAPHPFAALAALKRGGRPGR